MAPTQALTKAPTQASSKSSTLSMLASSEHEQVVFCRHQASGLRAIIAVHSTALGPGLGGTRFYPYASEDDAVADVLALSRAMTYKTALAGLDHGGAKAVIIGDPRTDKSEALLRAYGRFIASLSGRYVTACDIGTTVEDMDVIARESRWVTGRSPADHGAGDSSVLTSAGVFQGMRAAAAHRWGSPSLAGRRVGVSGVGKVGAKLTGLLVEDGAQVVVQDVSAAAVQAIQEAHPSVEVAQDVADLLAARLDVFAPCALGRAVDADVVATLSAGGTCQIVCGAANNQLADPTVADLLAAAGILYAPDYLVNSGGVIQVADELRGFSEARARSKAMRIFQTMGDVLSTAARLGITPDAAAQRVAELRIAEVSQVGGILVP